jgi:PAS domain S-box-containing protein
LTLLWLNSSASGLGPKGTPGTEDPTAGRALGCEWLERIKGPVAAKLKNPSRDYRQLQQIIVGLTDGVILIGADQKILWANDAALLMHRVRTISALGATVGQYCRRFHFRYRNNRSVEHGRYPIERAAAGESFSDVIVEVTPARDPEQRCIHMIRSLAITDDANEPDYLALIIKDETERFRAEERFETAFNANPAPAVICRIRDLIYVRVNPGFLEMTGYTRKELLGASFSKIDVLHDAQRRELAMERFKQGQTIPQMEARVPLPQGGFRHAIVAGEPIEIGEENCVLFTFADLETRVKAETALRQSEERFAKSFRLSPVPMSICSLKGVTMMDVNEAFKTMTGYAEDEVVGRNPGELNLWTDKAAQQQIQAALEKGETVRGWDLQLRAKDETLFECLTSADTVRINDEPCVLLVMEDITERKRTENDLMAAIEAVMADTSWFSRSVLEKLAALRHGARPRRVTTQLEDLTSREREVLGLICQGMNDKEMSKALKLSPNTVRNHVFSLYQKIGVNRRSAVIIWARERGISGKYLAKPGSGSR